MTQFANKSFSAPVAGTKVSQQDWDSIFKKNYGVFEIDVRAGTSRCIAPGLSENEAKARAAQSNGSSSEYYRFEARPL